MVLQIAFSGGIAAAAANNKTMSPILHLLLADKDIVTSTIKEDVVVVSDTTAEEILAVAEDDASGDIQLQVDGEMAADLQPGSIINIIPGADDRFPFGLAGRVVSVIANPDGTYTVTLQPVSYAEVVKESQVDLKDITLDASNFVGVIAPAAVEASDSAPKMSKASLGKNGYSFRDGAIVVRDRAGLPGGPKDTIGGMTVSLNAKIKLKDMGVDASKMRPFGTNTEASVIITGELDKITLTDNTAFSFTDGLKKLDLRLDCQLNAKVAFNAEGYAKFGYFSQAWKEVEDAQVTLLGGVKGKFEGLDVDEKIGKYPVAGLVWSVPCPQNCPVTTGQTQTPLQAAKALGVIVWVYVNLNGELTFDGNFTPVTINAGNLSLGVVKEENGEMQMVRSLPRSSGESSRLIEVLGVDGTVGLKAFGGVSFDVDFFMGGLYIAYVGADVGVQGTVGLQGQTSYGTNDLNSDWTWDGNRCRDASTVGVGAVFRAAAEFGVEIKTKWLKEVSGGFKYSAQLPTDEEMLQEGRHVLWWTKVWAKEACWADDDCNGDAGGTAYVDNCNICVGGNTGRTACAIDCNNDAGGTAYMDNCGICVGGNTGNTACAVDCNGDAGGAAYVDSCDICVGGSTGKNACALIVRLPDTGQTGDYTATFGEDSDYTINPPSYTDNGNGTVTDNVTGLMWQQANAGGGAYYNWYQAAGVYDATYNSSTQDVCGAATTGGHSDWRLPAKKELMSIVDYSRYNPSIDPIFTGTIASSYWSSTTYAYDVSLAWVVNFANGDVDYYNKSSSYYVRCVRGGQ